MNYKILFTPEFEKEIKRLSAKYPSIKIDFNHFLKELGLNPAQGTPLGKNCYKIRMAISSKRTGKSGGARVITCVLIVEETIILISIYDKPEKESISNIEIQERLGRYIK